MTIAGIIHCVGGVAGPPCGAPVTSRRTCPPCMTPARSIARRSVKTAWSLTRSSTACINFSCGIAEKQFAMSVSTTHRRPCQASSMRTCRASCADRLGRNPKLHGKKSASKTGSSTIFTAACTIRSRTAAIASGLRSVLPGLGISTCRAGNGRYGPARSSAASSPTAGAPRTPLRSAKVVLSMPGAPPLRRTAIHACHKTSSAVDLVPQRMEPTSGIGLGRPVEHMLQGTHLIPPRTACRRDLAEFPALTGRLQQPARERSSGPSLPAGCVVLSARPVLRPPPTPSRHPARFPAPHRL